MGTRGGSKDASTYIYMRNSYTHFTPGVLDGQVETSDIADFSS